MSNVIELCKKLISCKSVDGNLSEAVAYLQSQFEKRGFAVEVFKYAAKGKETAGLLAQYGEGSPHLVFSGHFDVVPSGDDSAWRFPPHLGYIENDILYGRGSSDMLGGLAAFMAASQETIEQGKINGKISFILSGDEELPIINVTKCIFEDLSARGETFDFCLVGEPTNPQQLGQEIKIGRRGDVFIKITSVGKQCHTAYPHLGINPIHNLLDLLEKIKNIKLDDGNEFFDPSTIQLTTIDVGNGAMNVVPEKATAAVDVRFNNQHNAQEIIDILQNLASQTSGEFIFETEIVGESFLTEVNDNCEKLKEIIFHKTGINPQYTTGGGTSDARFVKDYCPVVEFGLINATIHKSNECAKVADINLLKEIYKDFLQAYFSA